MKRVRRCDINNIYFGVVHQFSVMSVPVWNIKLLGIRVGSLAAPRPDRCDFRIRNRLHAAGELLCDTPRTEDPPSYLLLHPQLLYDSAASAPTLSAIKLTTGSDG